MPLGQGHCTLPDLRRRSTRNSPDTPQQDQTARVCHFHTRALAPCFQVAEKRIIRLPILTDLPDIGGRTPSLKHRLHYQEYCLPAHAGPHAPSVITVFRRHRQGVSTQPGSFGPIPDHAGVPATQTPQPAAHPEVPQTCTGKIRKLAMSSAPVPDSMIAAHEGAEKHMSCKTDFIKPVLK